MSSKMNLTKIENWGKERGLDKNPHNENAFIRMILEEIGEYIVAEINGYDKDQMVDALGDITVFCITELPKMGIRPTDVFLDYGRNISEIIKTNPQVNINELTTSENLTYLLSEIIEKPKDIKVEIIKKLCLLSWNKIQSLGYDVDCVMYEIYKEINSRTGSFDETQGKWIKDKSPEAVEKWYKADFSLCE